jgi:hypothetical protein
LFFQEEEEEEEEGDEEEEEEEEIVDLSLYKYISIYLSITRGCLKVRKKEVVFMENSLYVGCGVLISGETNPTTRN